MANGVATKAGARRAGFKFSLTHAQVMQLPAVTRGVTSTCYNLGKKRELPHTFAKNAVEAAEIGFSQMIGMDKFVSSVWMELWPQHGHVIQDTSNDEHPEIEEGDSTARRIVEGSGKPSVQAAATSGG